MSNNTKVDLKDTYRIQNVIQAAPSTSGVGNYSYVTLGIHHGSYQNIAQCQEFQVQSKLYDEFKVTSMKVSFRPFVSELTVANTGLNANVIGYTWIDRDGNTPISTSVSIPLKLRAYDSCRQHRIVKPWSRTVKLSSWWVDCGFASINPQAQGGNAQPWVNAGACQVLGFYAENLAFPTVGQTIGELVTEYRVQFRGKKPAAFSYDPESGSVIVTPLSSFPNKLESQNLPLNTSGVLGDHTIACVSSVITFQDVNLSTITVSNS